VKLNIKLSFYPRKKHEFNTTFGNDLHKISTFIFHTITSKIGFFSIVFFHIFLVYLKSTQDFHINFDIITSRVVSFPLFFSYLKQKIIDMELKTRDGISIRH
jgi:hypothetical protein